MEISVGAHALPPRADKSLESLLLGSGAALPGEAEDVTNPQRHLGLALGSSTFPWPMVSSADRYGPAPQNTPCFLGEIPSALVIQGSERGQRLNPLFLQKQMMGSSSAHGIKNKFF